MAFAQNFVVLFLLHVLLLLPINQAVSNCPPSFECGNLGTLEFPLTNRNRSDCGLFMMDNCSTDPVVQFGAGGYWYNVLENKSKNRFLVLDAQRESNIRTGGVCFGAKEVKIPASSSCKFTISPNMTIYACDDQSEETRSPFKKYYSRTSCPMGDSNVDVFYENPATSPAPNIDPLPYNCSMNNQIPAKPNQNSSADLSDLVTYKYEIEWNVSTECYACHQKGGQCLSDTQGQFHCEKGADENAIVWVGVVIFIVIVGGVLVIAGMLFSFLFWYCKKRRNCRNLSLCSLFGNGSARRKEQDIEQFLTKHGQMAQRRYTYSDLKKMTKSFSENLGKGGYGSVYKGTLPDGRLVAVKLLNESKENGEEFMNEVASISQTSHINVVTLLGFSFDGSKRALVYEFMPNGSLEKYLSSSPEDEGGLGWDKLFEIALCVARGLQYLHEGCITRILHFDIKPQNILLDKDFNPKIADFGLAKLCPNRTSIVSMLVGRGTIGYIAPEVFCSHFGDVSYKSDVYSYGMMLLEIAGEKKKFEHGNVGRASETSFPHFVHKQLESMDGRLQSMDDRLDHGIKMIEEESELVKRKLIIVGLWCIQTDPKDRPPMSKVVEMMEGKIESLQVPPRPYVASPTSLALDFSMASTSTIG